MTISYKELKMNNRRELNKVDIFFAFTNIDLQKELKDRNLNIEDVASIGVGGYGSHENIALLHKLLRKHNEQLSTLMKDDVFLHDMFYYELTKSEYFINRNVEPAVRACGISLRVFDNHERYQRIMKKAVKSYTTNNNLALN